MPVSGSRPMECLRTITQIISAIVTSLTAMRKYLHITMDMSVRLYPVSELKPEQPQILLLHLEHQL
jgi:hypothetical protein